MTVLYPTGFGSPENTGPDSRIALQAKAIIRVSAEFPKTGRN
jgi:hypothetical protein